MRHALRKPAGVDEYQSRSVLQNELYQPLINFAPNFVRHDCLKRRARQFDFQVARPCQAQHSLQGIQFPIAKSYAAMRAAELMTYNAAARYEAGLDCGAEANMAKMLAADASWEAANACVQTHGGFGFAEEYDIERKFREARLYTVAPISTNMILNFISEHVLDLPRSY